MPKKRVLSPQSVWDGPAVEAAFEAAGVKTSWLPKLHHWLLRHPGSTWHDLPDLPQAARRLLDERFTPSTSTLIHSQVSADGETTKMLVQLQDGLQVEAVIMRYDTSPAASASAAAASAAAAVASTDGTDGDASGDAAGAAQQAAAGGPRATLCVSSQVGCQMGCTFCATGSMGLTADLTTGEIVEQLVHATRVAAAEAAAAAVPGEQAAGGGSARDGGSTATGSGRCGGSSAVLRQLPISNVVFMGMGEPLNNYAAVKAAVGLMVDPRVFGLARRKVTVSTVGVIPRLLQLADDLPGVSLALSLHAPTQELRATIVPSAKAYKLDRLLEAVRSYQARTGQRIFIEYVMLGPEVNCTLEHAAQLGALLQGVDCTVNLIPWNPILSPSMPFGAPPPGVVAAFQEALKTQWGLPATVRQEKGQDISGACGQLVLEHGGRGAQAGGSAGGSAAPLRDVEDLVPQPPRAAAMVG